MRAIHTLLRNSIDYAGLFPPAGLEMAAAVENYAAYRSSPGSWALGRFVVTADRIAEFEDAAVRHLPRTGSPPWQLAALLGQNLSSDLGSVAEFNRRHASPAAGRAVIDSVEVKASSIRAAEDTMHRIPDPLQAYIEIPIDGDPGALVAAIARSGRRAKVRTGGVTGEAFPDPADLTRFMATCISTRVAFKATAGLHHPLRAEYRLTYAPDSPRGLMFGFLNVFLAAAFLRGGMGQEQARQVLEEDSIDALQIEDNSIQWERLRLSLDDLQRARDETIISFGSCSFTEPLQDLESLGVLPPRVKQA
jgi:hypothetical protein